MRNRYIIQNGYEPEQIAFCGNKFLTGNGYMGVRGTLCEYSKQQLTAINLAGVYDQVGEQWRESVNAPNGLYAYINVDGKVYALPDAKPKQHEMQLNMEDGILERRTIFSCEKGDIEFIVMQMVSMVNPHLIQQSLTINLSFDGSVSILTGIDGDVWDINGPHLEKMRCSAEEDIISVRAVTHEKSIPVNTYERSKYSFQPEETKEIFEKKILRKISFMASADTDYIVQRQICIIVGEESEPAFQDVKDFETELASHIQTWSKIWSVSGIEIDGDTEAETALNYSLYHLNCIAPRHSSSMSIPARGLSGQVYKGAVFWDTEMFMLDYYLHTAPEIARTLLMYRVNTLPGALRKAEEYGFDGAFYAWESQEDGLDACSDYNVTDVFTGRPMRTYFRDKQVHISAAIVYAIIKYVHITGDTTMMSDGGARVILECARFYRSLLLKRVNYDFYEIHDVIGPDEYHERVNNNAYTNAMAKFVFEVVASCEEYLDEDVSEFAEFAEKMYIPKAGHNGIIEQFDGYFKLEDCRVEDVCARVLNPKEYWGGANGVAGETQVIKQADVIAMMCMFADHYSTAEMRANLEFYEPRTEHGSSLSACMYSLLSCYIGDPNYAYPFFMKSARADLAPGGKEWAGAIYIGGTHPAAEGGAWIVAVKGFAGMKISENKIICTPNLPKKWSAMRFKINYRGMVYSVEVRGDKWHVTESK